LEAGALSVGLFIGILACLEAGYRIGYRSSDAHEGLGVIEAAVFALLGLLLAFSFGSGISGLDDKRQQIVQEANAIGTAYLRLDLLPADEQPAIRHLFRDYLDTRLRVYENLPDMSATERELAHGARVQEEIWSRAVTASRDDATQNVARLLLPASMR
jgi:hypothetical protein